MRALAFERSCDFGLPQLRERIYFLLVRWDCADEVEMDPRIHIVTSPFFIALLCPVLTSSPTFLNPCFESLSRWCQFSGLAALTVPRITTGWYKLGPGMVRERAGFSTGWYGLGPGMVRERAGFGTGWYGLGPGMVRERAGFGTGWYGLGPGMVRERAGNGTGMVRDGPGMVRERAGMVRERSGMVRERKIAEKTPKTPEIGCHTRCRRGCRAMCGAAAGSGKGGAKHGATPGVGQGVGACLGASLKVPNKVLDQGLWNVKQGARPRAPWCKTRCWPNCLSKRWRQQPPP